MSWIYTQQSNVPYVENCYQPAPLPTTPANNFTPDWPTPSTEPRLTQTPARLRGYEGTRPGQTTTQTADEKARGLGLGLHITASEAGQHRPSSWRAQSCAGLQVQPLPPPSASTRRGTSSTGISHTPFSASTTSAPPQLLPATLCTPPSSAGSFYPLHHQPQSQRAANMTQRRMSSHGQRPVMGPPETPSRGMIPQSPGLFSNLQFSPDLFSQHMMDPQHAPVYPQQRLFWDPATATPLQSTPQQFHTPIAFPDDFSTSFNSNSTIVPPNFTITEQDMPYDLPTVSQSMHSSFMHGPVFPAPFQTSPRLAPPQQENPTQFLSSPARRFGGEPKPDNLNVRRPAPELPAYHHQMQESKREKEIMAARDRRTSRTLKRPKDDDLVLKSVRRALSPRKTSRPPMTRSVTLSGLHSVARRSSSNLDNMSIDSGASSRSTRAGRSSPIRQVKDFTRRSSASASLRSRSSVTLAIDENGVARTIMNSVPESGDEDMSDDNMTDQMSSEDEFDQQMLYSFSGEPYGNNDSFMSLGDAREVLRSNAFLSLDPDRVAKISRAPPPIDPRLGLFDPASTIKRTRTETLASTNTSNADPGNAQQALRALLQERSKSASSHASTSSMQFHSSPPMQHSQLAGYNLSPTALTEPDLATPSTDVDSLGSLGATRCVCKSASPDGNIMLQCDSCSKWLHAKCVGLNNRNIPDVYICTFCEQTPIRGGTIRASLRQPSFHQSPLAHKSHHRLR